MWPVGELINESCRSSNVWGHDVQDVKEWEGWAVRPGDHGTNGRLGKEHVASQGNRVMNGSV